MAANQLPGSPDVAFSMMKKSDFLNSQPSGWIIDKATGKLRCDDQSLTVFSKDNRILGDSPAVQIGSQSDLDSFMERVQSKPIVTTALCSKPYSHNRDRYESESSDNESRNHVVEYVVVINTRHPQVAQLFQEAYNSAQGYIQQDKKFRVAIKISDSLRLWYIQNVRMPNQTDSVTYATHCDIYLVNGASEPSFADRCFNCEVITQKVFWCICFPFFLLCFVPYKVYKTYILGIVEKAVTNKLPVTYHDSEFQLGFNLMVLLYPPGTTFSAVTTSYYPPAAPLQQQPYPYQGPPSQQQGPPYQQQGPPYQQQGPPYQQQGPPYQQPLMQQPGYQQ